LKKPTDGEQLYQWASSISGNFISPQNFNSLLVYQSGRSNGKAKFKDFFLKKQAATALALGDRHCIFSFFTRRIHPNS
jgi:hypothetical protein